MAAFDARIDWLTLLSAGTVTIAVSVVPSNIVCGDLGVRSTASSSSSRLSVYCTSSAEDGSYGQSWLLIGFRPGLSRSVDWAQLDPVRSELLTEPSS